MNKLYFFILLFIISCFTLSAQTNFDKGDLLVYAVNSNVNSFCITNYSNSTEFVDEVFLVTFKDILPNTIIYITDNGWQRKLNNFFGTTEGVLKLTKRMDSTIEKGEVFSWGNNGNGRLGVNSTSDKWLPVRVLKGDYPGTNYLGDDSLNKIISVIAYGDASYALSELGEVYSWGFNSEGQLGTGDVIEYHSPKRVLKGTFTPFTSL